MGITIAENSKEFMERLLQKEFDRIDWNLEYIYDHATRIISAAREYGLNEKADELEQTRQYAII